MWTQSKAFINSYLFLCVLSFVLFGHPGMQRLVVIGWFCYTVRILNHKWRNELRFRTLLGVICITQLPGIILMFINLWCIATGSAKEWASGLLEAWYHPFIPVLEMLPRGYVGSWSDMYLQTCLIPLCMISLSALSWLIAGFMTRNFR